MKLPAGVQSAVARYEALSTRERALVVAALLVALWMIWSIALFDPVSATRAALLAEQATLQQTLADAQNGSSADPRLQLLAQEKTLHAALTDIDQRLAVSSVGLIAPQRMIAVIHDVLSRQDRLTLVSLHNKPVESLFAPPAIKRVDEAAGEMPANDKPVEPTTGPFVHPVELVIDGAYLDVLAYLHALEALPWRFQWQVLDLQTRAYPINRVRIELSTLSMDKHWIGV